MFAIYIKLQNYGDSAKIKKKLNYEIYQKRAVGARKEAKSISKSKTRISSVTKK